MCLMQSSKRLSSVNNRRQTGPGGNMGGIPKATDSDEASSSSDESDEEDEFMREQDQRKKVSKTQRPHNEHKGLIEQ